MIRFGTCEVPSFFPRQTLTLVIAASDTRVLLFLASRVNSWYPKAMSTLGDTITEQIRKRKEAAKAQAPSTPPDDEEDEDKKKTAFSRLKNVLGYPG